MKRVMAGLAIIAAGLVASTAFAAPASADPPAPWVFYGTVPGGQGDCNSFGTSLVQRSVVRDFICDNVDPPTWNHAGFSKMWVLY